MSIEVIPRKCMKAFTSCPCQISTARNKKEKKNLLTSLTRKQNNSHLHKAFIQKTTNCRWAPSRALRGTYLWNDSLCGTGEVEIMNQSGVVSGLPVSDENAHCQCCSSMEPKQQQLLHHLDRWGSDRELSVTVLRPFRARYDLRVQSLWITSAVPFCGPSWGDSGLWCRQRSKSRIDHSVGFHLPVPEALISNEQSALTEYSHTSLFTN